MMSGHDERRRIERALRFGVNGYVAKPVAPSTLYGQIRQTILHPRPYLRTEHYFGPQHPLITEQLRRKEHQAEKIQDTNDLAPAARSYDDAYHIEDVALFD